MLMCAGEVGGLRVFIRLTLILRRDCGTFGEEKKKSKKIFYLFLHVILHFVYHNKLIIIYFFIIIKLNFYINFILSNNILISN